MRNLKKGLASLLALLMLVSALPAMALAEEPAEGEAAPVTEGPGTLPETPAEKPEEPQDADEVIYNLLDMEVTVGTDAERAASGQELYELFDEDGGYTIRLEDNAFFPYEVQFTYEDDTWEEWFMDPEDTVTIGGHAFSVESRSSGDAQLTRVGLVIGGDYLPVYPEEKDFTAEPQMSPMSLLPLNEVRLGGVDLYGYLPEELKNVEVAAVLSGETIDGGAAVVWAKGYDSDDFTITDMGGTIDLRPEDEWNTSIRLELIVGTADQLDPTNTRYIATANISSSRELLQFNAAGTEEPRQTIGLYDAYRYEGSGGKYIYQLGVDKTTWQTGQEAYLVMGLSSEFDNGAETPLTGEVYVGYYDTVEAIEAAGAENVTAQVWEQDPDIAGYRADYSWKRYYEGMPEFTVVFKRGETALRVMPFVAYMYEDGMNLNQDELYADNGEGRRDFIENGIHYDWGDELEMEVCTITVDTGYAADGQYYLSLRMRNPADDSYRADHGLAYVQRAVVGSYDTAEAINAQPDVKEQLFSDADITGYQADFSRGVVFSVLDINGEVQQIAIKTVESEEITGVPDEPQPDSADTYFRMRGAAPTGGGYLDDYEMPYDADGYYYNGYQTVFLLNRDGTPVAEGDIIPDFYTGNKVTMYAGHNGASGVKQESGVTAVPFVSGKPIQYSAAAENGTHLKNYWVTFLTQQSGPKLFVNAANDESRVDETTGLPVREVFLDDAHNNHHDVFFANIGDADLTGLYVRLEDAKNVALDPYWTIREDSVKILGAFDNTDEPDNMAKVRLIPVEGSAGVISGTLVIGAANGDEVKLQLTGVAGTPKITTTSVVDGVQYVPYSSVIQTNNMYADDAVQFTLTDGELPEGVILKPNGEVYGVPTVTGEFTFTVKAAYNGMDALSDSREFTLTILDNTDTNVENATDIGYTLLDRVPDTMTVYEDQVFRSEGVYGQFVDFWLDGQKLVDGVDYDSEEGSTKITIRAQTFRDAGRGTHTIAAEFRQGGRDDTDSPLKRAAQNYNIKGGSSSGGSGGGSSKPAVKPPVTEPETPKTTADIFRDITANDWYYADVDWAYQGKLMIGVTDDLYAPHGLISPATVVTVLARMDKVDLSGYTQSAYPEVASGQWYTAAAVWAKETGLLQEGTFSAQPLIARAQFAVMLVKYLEHLGIDCALPTEPAPFADADLMTQEENEAFQVLYQFGIFKGIGNYYMDPQGSTTRAQLAVLLHRLSVFVENQKG